jgi:biotin-independent malonate decarboxylase gamma subunit
MNADQAMTSRGRTWFEALAGRQQINLSGVQSVLVGDAEFIGERVRLISVVPDPTNRFPRARGGEVGVEEGWTIAKYGRAVIGEKADGIKRPIVAIVDVPGQAYGLREELLGISLSCAAAADMYASARLAGHPVVSLVVGRAFAAGFLAHGYQAHRILALDDPGVSIHAMGRQAAARVTRRTVEELAELSRTIIPMAYDIRACAELGIVQRLIKVSSADAPSTEDIARVKEEIFLAIADARRGTSSPSGRVETDVAQRHRRASLEVYRRMTDQWSAAPA